MTMQSIVYLPIDVLGLALGTSVVVLCVVLFMVWIRQFPLPAVPQEGSQLSALGSAGHLVFPGLRYAGIGGTGLGMRGRRVDPKGKSAPLGLNRRRADRRLHCRRESDWHGSRHGAMQT